MAARILYFGRDTCHRLPVLVRSGYAVVNCISHEELCAALQSAHAPAAVLMADNNPGTAQQAISLLRSRSPVPLVLFRDSYRVLVESPFDLVIPTLTPPAQWLADIASLLAQCCLPAPSVRPRRAILRLHPESPALPLQPSQSPLRNALGSPQTASIPARPFTPCTSVTAPLMTTFPSNSPSVALLQPPPKATLRS